VLADAFVSYFVPFFLNLQVYPDNLAPPQQILIDASNGASDYGNKFGEPLIAGYTRTFGQRLPNGERREWLKPIMFRWGARCVAYTTLYSNTGTYTSESWLQSPINYH
jgi:phosphoribosylformylglycinamidine (FGAM) synthase-like enzyme